MVGQDGRAITSFWFDVMQDAQHPLRVRLEASKLLAEHGWGKPRSVEVLVSADAPSDVLHREKVSQSIDDFYAELDRLAGAG